MHAETTHCLDCGAALTGPFCSRCGQRDHHRVVPLSHLAHDLWHELFHLDQRLIRSLRLLVTKPGLLTLEFLTGRRTRFFPPFRLYMIVSFILFLVMGTLVPGWVARNSNTKGKSSNLVIGTPTPKESKAAAPAASEPKSKDSFGQRLEMGGRKAAENPAAFTAQVVATLPKILFLLLPLFALILKLLYLRRKILYAAHLIFALHLHAFAFLFFLAAIGLSYIPWVGGCLLWLAGMGTLTCHLLFAMRRVYAQDWGRTLLKAGLLAAAYLPLVFCGAIGAVILTLYKG